MMAHSLLRLLLLGVIVGSAGAAPPVAKPDEAPPGSSRSADSPSERGPARRCALHIAAPVKWDSSLSSHGAFVLREPGQRTPRYPVQVAPRVGADGLMEEDRRSILAIIPHDARAAGIPRMQLRPRKQEEKAPTPFSFRKIASSTIQLRESDRPVLAYHYGTITGDHVPRDDPRRSRSCYVHPIWGMNGEVLTADFPPDHFHHHGLFWTWPHVGVDGKEYDLWADRGGLRQKFLRWLRQDAGPVAAVLGVENGWFVGDRQIMIERVWLTAYLAREDSRVIDVSLTFIPVDKPVTLQGAPNKSYGGLTLRLAPASREATTITVPSGPTDRDLPDTPLKWADFTSTFNKPSLVSGAAILVHPRHPDFPPTWLTRHYGPLCVGWPGVKPRTFPPGRPFQLNYRIFIHRGAITARQVEAVYDAYAAGIDVRIAVPGRDKP